MGKVFSLFRRKKEAPLDEAEAQLKDLNAEVAREEERRNKLVAARRRAMFMLVLWGLPLMLAGIGWGGAAFHFDWWNGDMGFYHFLPALLAPFFFFFLRLTFGAWYDFRIRRANRHIGVLQTKKAKVVDDLESSEEFKKFLEQKKKWDQLARLKQDPTSTPVKPPPSAAAAAAAAAARTPVRPAVKAQAPPPSTPLSVSASAVPPSPMVTPAPALSASERAPTRGPAADSAAAAAPPATPVAQLPVVAAAATPAPTPAPAPVAATPKSYYRPVVKTGNGAGPRPPVSGAAPAAAAAKKSQGMLSWLTNVFIGDEEDDRYTAVPLMCQYCGAQNGLRENTHFKTAFYEFSCKSCNRLNQLRSAESLSEILQFAGQQQEEEKKPAADAPAAAAATAPAPEAAKSAEAKKDE